MKFDRPKRRRVIVCSLLIAVSVICIAADTISRSAAGGSTKKEAQAEKEAEEVFRTEKLMEIQYGYESLFPDMYVQTATEDQKDQEEADTTKTVSKDSKDEVKKVYLTFDDGPSENTQELLDILAESDIHATFFLIGESITEDKEELLKSMVDAGHMLGVHTYSHKSKDVYRSIDSYLDDFHKTYERIYEVTGTKPSIFRFPWGSVNCYSKSIRTKLIDEMERRGFTFYDWNVSAEDSVGRPSEYSIVHNVVDYYQKFREPVILMHDGSNNALTVKVLPQIIKSIKENGYEFGTLDEMNKPYQYPR